MYRPLLRYITCALAVLTVAVSIVSAQTVTFAPSQDVFFNPERGFWVFGMMKDSTNYNSIRSKGYSLCYANIVLDSFRQSNISQSKLNELQRAFDRMRAAGVKGIVRITYDNTSAGNDASLQWMEIHLAQLQPLFLDNLDMIAFFQAGMIGAWGEWHTSSHNHHSDPKPVWNLLLTYLPPERSIAVRTPRFVNLLEGLDTQPLTSQEAFSGSGRARIAHHNDCWLASMTDMGTYDNYSVIRRQEKEQIVQHSRYTPWGGETCAQTQYTTCSFATNDAARFHATYMHAGYHPDAIAQLTSQGCWETDFAKKLGYRFQLIDAVIPEKLKKSRQFQVSINLKNVGWAPMYNERPVFLRMFSGTTIIAEFPLTDNADPRRWLPESGTITLSGTARTPADIDNETVSLALWMPDKDLRDRNTPDFSIRTANQNTWDPAKGHNILIDAIEVIDFIPGDINNDITVGLDDFLLFADSWLESCFTSLWCDNCDINESGIVDFFDFALMGAQY